MEKIITRKARLIATKGGSGSATFRATLPTNWVREMGLSEVDRNVILRFDGEKIIITKEGKPSS